MAQQKNANLKDPILPYADTHVVGDFNGINNGNVNISWSINHLKSIRLNLTFILN